MLDALFWHGPEIVRYGVGENLYVLRKLRCFVESGWRVSAALGAATA
ncbi:AtzH-like domain-containing protein [Acetobacter conturbans]